MEKLKELERKFAAVPRNELLSKVVSNPEDKRVAILLEAANNVSFDDLFLCLEHISRNEAEICIKLVQKQNLLKTQFHAIWKFLTHFIWRASDSQLCALIDCANMLWDKTTLTDMLKTILPEKRVSIIKHFITHIPTAELTADHLEMCAEEYQRLLLPLVMKHVAARESQIRILSAETKKRKTQEACRHLKAVPDKKFAGDYSFINYVTGEQITFTRVVCVKCNSTLVGQSDLYHEYLLCDTSFHEQCPHPRQALVVCEVNGPYSTVSKPIESIYIQLPTFVHSSKFQLFARAKCQFCDAQSLPVVNYSTKDDPWSPCFDWEVHRSLQIHSKKSKKK